jgi:hypothetical protein
LRISKPGKTCWRCCSSIVVSYINALLVLH